MEEKHQKRYCGHCTWDVQAFTEVCLLLLDTFSQWNMTITHKQVVPDVYGENSKNTWDGCDRKEIKTQNIMTSLTCHVLRGTQETGPQHRHTSALVAPRVHQCRSDHSTKQNPKAVIFLLNCYNLSWMCSTTKDSNRWQCSLNVLQCWSLLCT